MSENQKKGLILPVPIKNGELVLSKISTELNEKSNGQLLEQLQIGQLLKKDEVRILWNLTNEYPAICAVGIGDIDSAKKNEQLEMRSIENVLFRKAAGLGSTELVKHGILNIILDAFPNTEDAVIASKLSTWQYQELREESQQIPTPSLNVTIDSLKASLDRGVIKANAQNFTRLLMSRPSNQLTPTKFAEFVSKELTDNVKVIAHDRAWIENEKMGAFLSVANGSPEVPPILLEISYMNDKSDEKPYVLVGKGITFDTGGINLKSTASIEGMYADMGGAACVVGTIKAVSELKLPINMIGLMPLTHNMPSGTATNPGDIIIARNGKSIGVNNTDAEGRLVLADALCYSQEFNPKFVIDIATLTGSIIQALGGSAVGTFSNSDRLFNDMLIAACKTGDRLWRMPLWDYYSQIVKNNTAYDLNNAPTKPKGGGTCTAAAFLREFVPDGVDWMHLDIAGVMDSGGLCGFLPENGMAGRPVCTLIQFFENLSSNK